MANFRIVTPAGGGDYRLEVEALQTLGAEIVELPAEEDAFIAGAKGCDAVYAKAMTLSARLVQALPASCRGIVLGSVGVDYVDVAAATARGIPVTNCPDTFIDEVADHAMALLLAGHRRIIEQDRMVREGRWREGRPQLSEVPRLMGSTLGFIAFGRVARLTARRAKGFGLNLVAYDPFIEELTIHEHGARPSTLEEVLQSSDFVSMHAPATPQSRGMLTTAHFRMMKPTAWFINTGRAARRWTRRR